MLLSGRIANLSGRIITITQTGNSGQYCYSTDWKNLICNKDLSWAIRNIFEWDEFNEFIEQYFISYFTGTLMTWENGMICVKSWDILDCNTNPSSLWGWTTITGNSWQRCQYQCSVSDLTITWNCRTTQNCLAAKTEFENQCGTGSQISNTNCIDIAYRLYGKNPSRLTLEPNTSCSIACNQNAPTCDGECTWGSTSWNGIITIYQWWTLKWSFSLNQNTNTGIYLDAGGTWTANDARVTIYQWWAEKWYFTLNQNTNTGIYLTDANTWVANQRGVSGYVVGPTMSQVWFCWKTDTNGDPARRPCWSTTWLTLLSGVNNMYCKYVEWDKNSWIQCTYDAWWGSSYRSTTTEMNMSWNNVTMLQPSEPYIYSDSLQIVPKNQKAIVRFDNNGVQIWTDASAPTYVGLSVGWPITLWNINTNNYIYFFASWNATSPNAHYEIAASKKLRIGVDNGAFMYLQSYQNTGSNAGNGINYSQYKIWINNTTPKATLDVNWSIRINTSDSSCAIETCNSNTRWTIVFRWGDFYGCTDSGWLKFTGTAIDPSIPVSVNCNVSSIQTVRWWWWDSL